MATVPIAYAGAHADQCGVLARGRRAIAKSTSTAATNSRDRAAHRWSAVVLARVQEDKPGEEVEDLDRLHGDVASDQEHVQVDAQVGL